MHDSQCNQHKTKKGYIALASILVIAAVVLVINVSVALLSINEVQASLSGQRNEASLNFVETCIEDALMRLNRLNTIPTTITIPAVGTCSITIDSQVGSVWTFTTTGTLNGYTKRVQVQATRSGTITINSWKEL